MKSCNNIEVYYFFRKSWGMTWATDLLPKPGFHNCRHIQNAVCVELFTGEAALEQVFKLLYKAKQATTWVEEPPFVTKQCQPCKLKVFIWGRHSKEQQKMLIISFQNALSCDVASNVKYNPWVTSATCWLWLWESKTEICVFTEELGMHAYCILCSVLYAINFQRGT